MKRKTSIKQLIRDTKAYLLYAGFSQEEYRGFEAEIQKGNKRNLMVYSSISALCLSVMFLLSFLSRDVADSRMLYAATALVMLGIYIAAKYLRSPVVLLVCMYLFISVLFCFGIVLGTVTRPDEQTVSFVALLLTVPLLFTDMPVRMMGSIVLHVIVFIIVAVRVKADYVLTADIIDVCVFGAISIIVSTYMMQVKCQRIQFAQKVLLLSEMDVLTGLRNRNSYESSMADYPSRCRTRLSCVFVDVDGLHEMNNTQGHEAGDRMLQQVAQQMRSQFGKEHTFRIGGDEFVAFAADSSEDQLQDKIASITAAITAMGYHVSIGYDIMERENIQMEALIRNAETRMYEKKQEYYDSIGNTRITRK